jgi:hypothetical protein
LSIRATYDSVKRRRGAVFTRFKSVRRSCKLSILAVWTAVNASRRRCIFALPCGSHFAIKRVCSLRLLHQGLKGTLFERVEASDLHITGGLHIHIGGGRGGVLQGLLIKVHAFRLAPEVLDPLQNSPPLRARRRVKAALHS